MKKIILFLLFPIIIFSQSINSDKNGYYEIIKADSLSKQQIYKRAKEWVALNYKSAKDVIQLDTEDKIIIKGIFKVPYLVYEHTYNHSLIMSFKDNRFKVELILNSIHTNLSTETINIEKGNLSTSKEEIFEIYKSDPRLQEENIKKMFVDDFMRLGYSEKKALKLWEKSKTDMLSSIPKTVNDIDMKPIYHRVEEITKKVENIFNSIEK